MAGDVSSPEFPARLMTARAEAGLIRQLAAKRAQEAAIHPGCCTCDACRVRTASQHRARATETANRYLATITPRGTR
ncbi:hypothetical protein ABZ154_15205 [Streptomyces sp. NPDC006261]|uniref:hypothetical protein n=1 Tax=Streptomyces sp. NPDC006261 TaxID=3156739 RepID=UPI0033A88BE1